MNSQGGRFSEFKSSDLYDAADQLAKQADNNVACYKCKKCRFKLFTVNSLVKHLKNFETPTYSESKAEMQARLDYYKRLNELSGSESKNECSSELYIEPLEWFISKLSDLNGKVRILRRLFKR